MEDYDYPRTLMALESRFSTDGLEDCLVEEIKHRLALGRRHNMLQRLYVHNFGVLQNFEIKPGDNDSLLFIGENGVGKSTLAKALSILQQVASGTSRVGSLLKKEDFTLGRTDEPMVFKIDILLEGKLLEYGLILEMPDGFKEMRIMKENFSVDGNPVFTRQVAQVSMTKHSGTTSEFSLDWHTVALPLINVKADNPVEMLRNWLRRMHILAPLPPLMKGDSSPEQGSMILVPSCENFAAYLKALLIPYPQSYITIINFLQELIPDLKAFNNIPIAIDVHSLQVEFGKDGTPLKLPFGRLSDGEKCMFLCATLLAAKEIENMFIFWDEPDNYMALPEVEHFIGILRQKFREGSQIWMTSHNNETMNCFSHENTFLLRHKDHRNPVELRPIDELLKPEESVSRKLRRNELE